MNWACMDSLEAIMRTPVEKRRSTAFSRNLLLKMSLSSLSDSWTRSAKDMSHMKSK